MTFNRRKILGSVAAAVASSVVPYRGLHAQTSSQVVIIGGGAGGATLAAYLRRLAPEIAVTLVERNPSLVTSSFSNHVIGGWKTIEELTHSYDQLTALGVKLVRGVAIDVDSVRKSVSLLDGTKLAYDRLVLSPGVDFKYDAIEGYSPSVAKWIPHAWRAGEQTLVLKSQLEAFDDGETVLVSIPREPMSYALGAYERACTIARVLKARRPKSKLIVLDGNRQFDLQDVFRAAFKTYYAGVLEYLPSSETASFEIASIDGVKKSITAKSGVSFKVAIANIIPPQIAGAIALRAGCVEGDWCPIDPETFASTKVRDVYVIGDAAQANDMPKSAFAANSQAKLVAGHLAATLAGKDKFPVHLRNAMWAMVGLDDWVKAGGVYTAGVKDGRKVLLASAQFGSTIGDEPAERRGNGDEAAGWYAGMSSDMFGGKV